MKLMVVDDEPMVREGIKRAFNWEKDQIEIAGEAGDGKTALLKAVQIRPDIIICDIRMPFLDGLSFVKQVRNLLPEVGFIMLTAYAEKEYMLEAIRCGVHDFLLKPAGLEEIRNTVLKIRDQLMKEREQASVLAQRNELLEENVGILFEHYFASFLLGGQKVDKVIEVMKVLYGSAHDPYFALLLFRTNPGREWTLIQQLSETLAPWKPKMIRMEDRGVILLNADTDAASGNIHEALKGIWKSDGQEYLLSGFTRGVKALPAVYLAMKEALQPDFARPEEKPKESRITANGGENPEPAQDGETVAPEMTGGHTGRALRYIQAHYQQEDLQLNDVAKALYLSPAYVSRILNEDDGRGFVGWLRYFRIRKAREMLEETDLKFNEISDRVGYKSYKVFSEHFIRETGQTVGEWKRKGTVKNRS